MMLAHCGKPCKIADSVCPSAVLLFKCSKSLELRTPHQQSQAPPFQPLEPQKSEHTEMCRLSLKSCSCWNKHGLTLPWLTEPPTLLSSEQGLVCTSLSHPFHCFRFWKALFYLLFPNFPSLLQCMMLTLLAVPCISYRINLFCHLIFAQELSFRKSDFAQKHPNKSVNQKEWMRE